MLATYQPSAPRTHSATAADFLPRSECDWAIPRFGELDEVLAGRVLGSYMSGTTTHVHDPQLQAVLAAPAAMVATTSAHQYPELPLLACTFSLGAAVAVVASRLVNHRRRAMSVKAEPLLGLS